jgi:hypothetical protein
MHTQVVTMYVGATTLDWARIGDTAFGLMHGGLLVAVAYWDRSHVAETPGGEPVATNPGFSWVACGAPLDHFFLFEAREPSDSDWTRARDQAARAYFASSAAEHR